MGVVGRCGCTGGLAPSADLVDSGTPVMDCKEQEGRADDTIRGQKFKSSKPVIPGV